MTKAGTRILFQPEVLPLILNRERARADRMSSEFCVVLFGLRGGQADAASMMSLGEAVGGRARETDEVVAIDTRFICAVLPGTPSAGGRRFAEHVRESLNGQAEHLIVEVLSYPTSHRGEVPSGGEEGGNGAAATYAIDRNGGGRYSPLLSAFLRLATATKSVPAPGGPATLDAMFAAPPPFWKRSMDVVTAAVALVCLSPLLLLIAATVRLTSGSPVIFKQRRAGLLGRPFEIYKFRTMVVDAEKRQVELRASSEQDGPAFKMTHDPRVTRLGSILRKTSLDELPQLWNVLKGDMSLVGPRPLPCSESSACSQWQRRRLDVTPGITCLWQVKGRSRVSFPEWMRMDINYVRSRRLLRDISLLLLTVPAVLLRRGAK